MSPPVCGTVSVSVRGPGAVRVRSFSPGERLKTKTNKRDSVAAESFLRSRSRKSVQSTERGPVSLPPVELVVCQFGIFLLPGLCVYASPRGMSRVFATESSPGVTFLPQASDRARQRRPAPETRFGGLGTDRKRTQRAQSPKFRLRNGQFKVFVEIWHRLSALTRVKVMFPHRLVICLEFG